MRTTTGFRFLVQLLLATLVLLVLPLGALSLFALEGYERYLAPELRQKADTVGRAVASRVERALELGIPLDQLVGVEDYLEPIVHENEGLGFIALLDGDGKVLHAAGISSPQARQVLASGPQAGRDTPWIRLQDQVSHVLDLIVPADAEERTYEIRGQYLTSLQPILRDDLPVGVLAVGVPQSFLGQQIAEIAFDTAILLLVGLLVAFELLLLVISVNLTFPLGLVRDLMADIRDGRIARVMAVPVKNEVGRLLTDLNQAARALASRAGAATPADTLQQEKRSNLIVVRLLAFLFILAEELARPFLPIYFNNFASAIGGGDATVLIGLPLSVFMLAAALSLAFLGPLMDGMDRRRTFLTGSLLATAGLFGTALAQSYYDLLLWRALAGIGYGLNFAACQGYVFDHTTIRERGRGISMFVGGIMTADICGPAIGGILADRIGFSATLLMGGGVALISGILVYRLMEPPEQRLAEPASLTSGLRIVSTNWRYWVLLVLGAVPAKLVLTGFLFYLVPLYLTALGSSQSEIGRILMVYGIAALALTSVFAYLADRLEAHGAFVALGGMITGLGMLPILFGESPERVLLATLTLGVGQAMSIPSLFVVVTRVARREIYAVGQASVLGVFRLTERLGAAAGPFAIAALLGVADFATAMATAGLISILSSVVFGTVFLSFGYERDRGLAAAE